MQTQLRNLLTAATTMPVDWGWNSQGATSPRIVLQVISDVTDYTHDGPSGYLQNRVQIDIYAPTYKAATETMGLVDGALSGLRSGLILGAFKAGRRDFPPDLGAGETLARISIDYMIHHNQE